MSPTAVAEGQQRMSKIFKEYASFPFSRWVELIINNFSFLICSIAD